MKQNYSPRERSPKISAFLQRGMNLCATVVLFFFTLFFSVPSTYGQEYLWSNQFTGPSSSGSDVVVDANGNFYVVGSFGGTVNIGGFVLNATGSNDFFFAKFNINGVAQWVRRIGTPGGNVYPTGAALFKDTNDEREIVGIT